MHIATKLGTCSGALISPEYVVTALHCVYDPVTGDATIAPGETEVVVGASSGVASGKPRSTCLRPGKASKAAVTTVAEIFTTAKRGAGNGAFAAKCAQEGDVALLKLSKPVKYKGKKGPSDPYMCLDLTDKLNLDKAKTLFASGYGKTGSRGRSGLKTVAMSRKGASCEHLYGALGADAVCRVPKKGRLCGGDSGGPLWGRVGSKAYLSAVHTRSLPCDSSVDTKRTRSKDPALQVSVASVAGATFHPYFDRRAEGTTLCAAAKGGCKKTKCARAARSAAPAIAKAPSDLATCLDGPKPLACVLAKLDFSAAAGSSGGPNPKGKGKGPDFTASLSSALSMTAGEKACYVQDMGTAVRDFVENEIHEVLDHIVTVAYERSVVPLYRLGERACTVPPSADGADGAVLKCLAERAVRCNHEWFNHVQHIGCTSEDAVERITNLLANLVVGGFPAQELVVVDVLIDSVLEPIFSLAEEPCEGEMARCEADQICCRDGQCCGGKCDACGNGRKCLMDLVW